MSDAFADLWNSSAPSKPTASQTLGGSAATPSTKPMRKTQDVFSLLSSGNPTLPVNKPYIPTPNTQSQHTAPSQQKQSATTKPINGNDIFGDLLGESINTSGSASRMTIAERAAQAEKQRLETLQKQQQAAKLDASAWAGLDSLADPSFTSAPNTQQAAPPAKSNQLFNDEDDWGLNDFAPSSLSGGHAQRETQGNSLLGESSNDEDDILGDLSKPVGSRAPPADARSQSPILQSMSDGKPGGSRPASPPPHILGQLVEMGFSVQQARIALAATDTGTDVQAALETLLSNGAASPPTPRRQSPVPAAPRAHRERMKQRSRASSLQGDDEQRQADKLIAQASEIGLNMLNKASIFWREGKGRVQKAYEERAASANLAGTAKKATSSLSGRPKWMADRDHEEDERGSTTQGAFKDGPTSGSFQLGVPASSHAGPARSPREQSSAEAGFLSNEPTVYVSPWRRGKLKPKANSIEASPTVAVPRPPSPVKAVARSKVISASQMSMSLSRQNKEKGAERFKLGQYSEAEAAYSAAIAALPDSHLLLVPLYNNRALTRLKTGDYVGATEDTTASIVIIGAGYHPAYELKVSREEEGSSVELAEGLVKALKRRAEALEGREKWEDAKKDWETLAAKDWARPNFRNEAVRGAGRCRGMVQASSSTPVDAPRPSKPPVPSRLTKPAIPAVPARPSEALSRLRSVNDAAEAEDQVRYELKDVVDAKISAWKTGKETNIRALLGSLDIVLWPELGLQKVGMAELVSTSQVKIRYTKTIAKLHPDKLNPTNSTIEQRMLANAVFGTLNDAWNAFKQ